MKAWDRRKGAEVGMAGGKSRDEVRQGLTMPGRALRKLAEVGIFAKPAVSLEHQHLAHRYVVRGTESGGAVEGIGHYVTFCGETGERLAWLHPLDAVGVNGVHAVVIAPSFVRVEMFRRGHTYDLLITRHAPGIAENGRRPPLESKVLFRALEGYVALEGAQGPARLSHPDVFTHGRERESLFRRSSKPCLRL